jgi:hypothetical protein
MLARQMARKFPADIGKLDSLLGRCTEEDLEWLGEELLVAKQFATLRRRPPRLRGDVGLWRNKKARRPLLSSESSATC